MEIARYLILYTLGEIPTLIKIGNFLDWNFPPQINLKIFQLCMKIQTFFRKFSFENSNECSAMTMSEKGMEKRG
jgi:hypothetical protein